MFLHSTLFLRSPIVLAAVAAAGGRQVAPDFAVHAVKQTRINVAGKVPALKFLLTTRLHR